MIAGVCSVLLRMSIRGAARQPVPGQEVPHQFRCNGSRPVDVRAVVDTARPGVRRVRRPASTPARADGSRCASESGCSAGHRPQHGRGGQRPHPISGRARMPSRRAASHCSTIRSAFGALYHRIRGALDHDDGRDRPRRPVRRSRPRAAMAPERGHARRWRTGRRWRSAPRPPRSRPGRSPPGSAPSRRRPTARPRRPGGRRPHRSAPSPARGRPGSPVPPRRAAGARIRTSASSPATWWRSCRGRRRGTRVGRPRQNPINGEVDRPLLTSVQQQQDRESLRVKTGRPVQVIAPARLWTTELVGRSTSPRVGRQSL